MKDLGVRAKGSASFYTKNGQFVPWMSVERCWIMNLILFISSVTAQELKGFVLKMILVL